MEYIGQNGRRWTEKPEELTQLHGNVLVPKSHPRIRFRGQMDWLQGAVVAAQVELEERRISPKLVEDLEDVLGFMRQITRSEVLDVPLASHSILGLTPEELRAQSHDPDGYFGVKTMLLPHRSMGFAYVRLNQLRAQARVAETAAVEAFQRPSPAQREVLRGMNRLSSAFHILMCRWLSGQYGDG